MASVDEKITNDAGASCSLAAANFENLDAAAAPPKQQNSFLVDEEEIFDLDRLELGDDDESWLLAAPAADGGNKTGQEKNCLLKWLRKDYDRLDLRTRKALITRLENVTTRRRDDDLEICQTPKTSSETPDSLNKTYKIEKIVPIKRPCSPDDISRKLCFEEKIDNQSEKIDNRDSKRKKSIENNHLNENPSPDINQIRLLASRQEQDLRNCMQQTQLSHQKRKISSSSNANAQNQLNATFAATPASRLAPPPASQNCKNYATTSSKNRQNAGASKQQRLNGFSAQKNLAFQKSMPNLLNGENFGQSSAANDLNGDPLAASCHVQNAAQPTVTAAADAGRFGASASDKGSDVNLNQRFPITNSTSAHTVSSSMARGGGPEPKRPWSSRLPTPRSRLPVPGSTLKFTTKFQRPTTPLSTFNKTCIDMDNSWKEGCI